MKNKLSIILSYFGEIESFKNLRKNEAFNNLQQITNQMWFEPFFEFSKKRNTKMINVSKNSKKWKKLELFLRFIEDKKKKIIGFVEKDLEYSYGEHENFFIISIDEYLNGRKKGIIFDFFQINWGKNLWRNLEKTFEVFFESLKKESFSFPLLFFLFESFRYDKILEKKKKEIINEESLSFFSNSQFHYFTNNHRIFLGLFFHSFPVYFSNRTNRLKEIYNKNSNFKENLKVFFQGKGLNIKKFFDLGNYFNYRGSLESIRSIYDFFSKIGLVNFKVFWTKKPFRNLTNILRKIFNGNIERELYHYEKALQMRKNHNEIASKNQNWFYQIRKNKNCNFLKSVFIFGVSVINLGTTNHSFLYEILLELEKLQLWTKFLIGSLFSLVNFGNQKYFTDFFLLMDNDAVSDYLKGGILFGMGLNLKDVPQDEKFFIKNCETIIKNKTEPVIKYGACLALGLSGVRIFGNPKKSQTYRLIKNIVTTDSVAGEGAALSMGLLFMGTSSSKLLEDIVFLIQEIEYERIRKTLILSLGLIFLGCKDESDEIFERLILEKNPGIRQGAVFIYCLAYIGTGDIFVLKRLLRLLTMDSDDNVKRTLVVGIGFVFFSKFHRIEKIFLTLIDHYNPFVRYGTCFALFLSSLEHPSIEKVQFLLDKLTKDKIDFVRQGALISLGLTTFGIRSNKKKKRTKQILKKCSQDILENNISKFGSYVGLSLIELSEKFNLQKVPTEKHYFNLVSGLFLFINYWSWIPNLFFIFLINK